MIAHMITWLFHAVMIVAVLLVLLAGLVVGAVDGTKKAREPDPPKKRPRPAGGYGKLVAVSTPEELDEMEGMFGKAGTNPADYK